MTFDNQTRRAWQFRYENVRQYTQGETDDSKAEDEEF